MANQPRTPRPRAEAILDRRRQDTADMPVADLQQLVYELQVHQVELEMQNEELRQGQVELEAARDRYAHLYDFAPVGYLRLDADGVILEANLTAARLFEMSQAQLIGHRLTDWVAPEAQDTAHCLHIFTETTTHTCDLWMQRQDGTPFYAHCRSLAWQKAGEASLDWCLAFIDLTTLRQQTEEQLAWKAAIVDNSRDAIIGINLEGTIVSWNAAAERLYGYRAIEVIGQSIDLLAPPGYDHAPSSLLAAVQRGERVEVHETQRLTKDGTCLDVSLTLSPIQIREGAVSGISVIARDITLRKQREVRLRAIEQALRESQARLRRLAQRQQQIQERERARIAREIHDELAQLLTSLQIDLAWLIEQNPMTPEMHERLQSMSAQVDYINMAVHHIGMELRPRLLDDLGLLAAIEWQLTQVKQHTGLTYTLKVPSTAEIRPGADQTTDLFRIFQEALTNVVRHAEASRVEVRLSLDADGICLEMIDNGRGITLTEQIHSNALGLLGMRERAQRWGGEVTVEGQPGMGTTVIVRIPYQVAEDVEDST